MTMVMPRTNISKEITATLKSAYGQKIKVFDTEIPHSIRAVEATAEGKSIFAYDKSGKIAAAYEPVSYTHLDVYKRQPLVQEEFVPIYMILVYRIVSIMEIYMLLQIAGI